MESFILKIIKNWQRSDNSLERKKSYFSAHIHWIFNKILTNFES